VVHGVFVFTVCRYCTVNVSPGWLGQESTTFEHCTEILTPRTSAEAREVEKQSAMHAMMAR